MRKFKAFLVIMTAVLLASCGSKGSSEVTQTSAASETAETTSATVETTAEVTTTATTAAKTVTTAETTEAEIVSETFTTTEADYAELYGITAEETEIEEDIKNKNGLTICGFYANYPIFSGGDEVVIGKINEAVKDYIDGVYGEEKQYASENNDDAFMEGFLFMRERIVTYDSLGGEYYTYRINGNLLSVYFSENFLHAGGNWIRVPAVLTFDLRTGEQIDWNDLIEDKKGFAVLLDSVARLCADSDDFDNSEAFAADYIEKDYEEYFADAFERMAANGNNELYSFGTILYSDGSCGLESSRLTLEGGCVCYWLGTHNNGYYSDVPLCVRIPVEYVLPYMNDSKFDDISPLFGSSIDYIDGNGYNIPQEQADEFIKQGGRYIDSELIIENNTEVNNEQDN